MGYLSILFGALIIGFLAFFGWRQYFSPPGTISKNTQASLEEYGINSSAPKDVLSDVRTKLNNAGLTESAHVKEYEDFR